MANKQAIQEWVDTLRSGNYKQGCYKLKKINTDDENVHCCLGVATEIYISKFDDLTENMKPTDLNFEKGVFEYLEHINKVDSCLPDSVAEWIGVDDHEVTVDVDLNKFDVEVLEDEAHNIIYHQGQGYLHTNLAYLNDQEVSFETIAAIIEDNFLNT